MLIYEELQRNTKGQRDNAVLTLESIFCVLTFRSCAKSMESVKLDGQRKVLT